MSSVDFETDGKPTPSVDPDDVITNPDRTRRERVLEREPIEACECGGTRMRETVATGTILVEIWNNETFDPSEFELVSQREEIEHRIRCNRCGEGGTA